MISLTVSIHEGLIRLFLASGGAVATLEASLLEEGDRLELVREGDVVARAQCVGGVRRSRSGKGEEIESLFQGGSPFVTRPTKKYRLFVGYRADVHPDPDPRVSARPRISARQFRVGDVIRIHTKKGVGDFMKKDPSAAVDAWADQRVIELLGGQGDITKRLLRVDAFFQKHGSESPKERLRLAQELVATRKAKRTRAKR